MESTYTSPYPPGGLMQAKTLPVATPKRGSHKGGDEHTSLGYKTSSHREIFVNLNSKSHVLYV